MINQTNIDAEVKAASEKVIASNQRQARNRCYFNDNAVIRKFIFDTTGYEIFDPNSQSINSRESNFEHILVFVLVAYGCCVPIVLLGKLIAGHSFGINDVIVVFCFFPLLAMFVFYSRYQERVAKQFKQEITIELLKELGTLNTLSETGRTFISKLIDQLPPISFETDDPIFILNTIYKRDIAIYDANKKERSET